MKCFGTKLLIELGLEAAKTEKGKTPSTGAAHRFGPGDRVVYHPSVAIAPFCRTLLNRAAAPAYRCRTALPNQERPRDGHVRVVTRA